MSTSALVLMIIAIIMISRHRRDRRYLDRRLAEHGENWGQQPALADNSHLEREVGELRERVRVLERIVTDANTTDARNSRRISDEIDALRDRQV